MSSPNYGYGKAKNRAAKEQALILAAGRLFALRGYESTTTREIAIEAGCAEGLIHRYFAGKAGLLMALIRQRVSQEVEDMSALLPPRSTVAEELLQLVAFEVDRMWEEREFYKIIVPRAIVDPSIGDMLRQHGPGRRAHALVHRLVKIRDKSALSHTELETLAHFIGVLGFVFGFFRPAVLGGDRAQAREIGLGIARMLASRL
jgi:AcrR family transcriptional regulator